jgi:SAM-dependent methyltransferase
VSVQDRRLGEGLDPPPIYVARYYDAQPEREWARLERHRTEFAVTLRALAEHLPPPPAHLLDCGGGPGRYAIELARRGYEVTLFDLSAACLRLAREKAAEAGVTLAGYEHAAAADLSRFPDEAFDAVLLVGPLYHLLAETERQRALAGAWRVLKPGGSLFAACVGRCAGLEVVTVLGIKGLASSFEDEINALSGAAWDVWVDLNYRLAADPSLHGDVERLLVVAVKPRWRTVLREIARRLSEAGVTYKIVGGTAVALHGVPAPVKDLDLETDAEGAYRFQSLFADHAVKPVALGENETYRSHFGRFDVDGVMVEVMGDVHRRAAGGWLPTATQTETAVDLDGLPVRVSWLEEGVLTYIRRGRLDRAAQCLPHCDPGRLLALLRGEQVTAVL